MGGGNEVLLVEFRGEAVGIGEDVNGLDLSTMGDTAAADELPNEKRFTDSRRSRGALDVVRCRGKGWNVGGSSGLGIGTSNGGGSLRGVGRG